MRLRTSLAAVAAAALYASPAAAATPDQLIPPTRRVALESNATREITLPIQGLGQDWNVLVPCFGFSITGPGVDLAGANLQPFGHTIPENAEPARRRDPRRAAPGRRQLRRSPSRPRC